MQQQEGLRSHLIILDPELAGSIISKLGLAECEDGASGGDLRVLHGEISPPVLSGDGAETSTHPTPGGQCFVNTLGTPAYTVSLTYWAGLAWTTTNISSVRCSVHSVIINNCKYNCSFQKITKGQS